MRVRKLSPGFVLLLNHLMLVAPAAPVRAATLAGTVRDEVGRPLAGAQVVIRSAEASLRREFETDSEGNFAQAELSPGQYAIAVLQQGEILWAGRVTVANPEDALELQVSLTQPNQAKPQLHPELERLREAEQRRRQQQDTWQRHYHRGLARLRQREAGAAVEEFRAALALAPGEAGLEARLAEALAGAGQLDEAARALRRAVELEPSEAAHHNNLGTLLVETGELTEGLAEFERAAALDPARAATYQYNQGAALLNAKRLREAVTMLRRAARSDRTPAIAHYFLGVALFEAEESESTAGTARRSRETTEAFRRYLQLEPDGPYAEAARNYLVRLGAGSPDMLLPHLPPAEELE
jgi:Flp pilus assembly protein TadD